MDILSGQSFSQQLLIDVFCVNICRKIAGKLEERTWIGLNDINTEGEWYWIDGVGFAVNSSLWRSGEPNNFNNNEDCAFLKSKYNNKIYDQSCNDHLYGLCDIE